MHERRDMLVSKGLRTLRSASAAAGAVVVVATLTGGKDTAHADVVPYAARPALAPGVAWQIGSVTAGNDQTFRQELSYDRAKHRLIYEAQTDSLAPINQTCGANLSVHYVMDKEEGPITLENQSHPACADSSTGFGNHMKIKQTLDFTHNDMTTLRQLYKRGVPMEVTATAPGTGSEPVSHKINP